MGDLTLRKLCEALQISRRTVQGYEKHGLVKSTGRTKRGYLLYNAAAQYRILEVRRYQQYGIPVKEIAALLSLPAPRRRGRLIQQRTCLMQKKNGLEAVLQQLTEEIEALCTSPNTEKETEEPK